MKTVLQIFRSDLRGVSRQFFAMVILIAICALPAMRECVAGMYGRASHSIGRPNGSIGSSTRARPGVRSCYNRARQRGETIC